MNPLSEAQQQCQAMYTALADLRGAPQQTHAFCNSVRGYSVLLAALPARYGEVLLGLLDRLESSAMFSEESCSFSQQDLLANLALWQEKAQALLHPEITE
ncbi:hypothetical protein [Variovorax sp. HJSM1_2]|uniref:hypothetical protein n=1 Tax=Variovorax sp. HJSM1_2 TaxID=3366263 RepID=UPI003BE4B1BA